MNLPISVTNSRWEKFVDYFMMGVETRLAHFEAYCKSKDGRYLIQQIQLISTLAAAIILAGASPFTVMASAAVGVIIRSLSAEQLNRVQEALSRISTHLPFGVKALATVIAITYNPMIFPIIAGLTIGFEIGARVSPYTVVKGIDKAVNMVDANKVS